MFLDWLQETRAGMRSCVITARVINVDPTCEKNMPGTKLQETLIIQENSRKLTKLRKTQEN